MKESRCFGFASINEYSKGAKEDKKEYPLYRVEISSSSHPFYTGETRTLDTAGRVERFKEKQAKAKQEGKTYLVALWRCAWCQRADLPYIFCFVAPYVVGYRQLGTNWESANQGGGGQAEVSIVSRGEWIIAEQQWTNICGEIFRNF